MSREVKWNIVNEKKKKKANESKWIGVNGSETGKLPAKRKLNPDSFTLYSFIQKWRQEVGNTWELELERWGVADTLKLVWASSIIGASNSLRTWYYAIN